MGQPEKALHVLMIKGINTDAKPDDIVRVLTDFENQIGLHVPGDYQQTLDILSKFNISFDKAQLLERQYQVEQEHANTD